MVNDSTALQSMATTSAKAANGTSATALAVPSTGSPTRVIADPLSTTPISPVLAEGAASVAVVALLGSFEDDEYRPEYGTLVVRDVHGAPVDLLPPHDNPLLRENGTYALSGTIGSAGDGWLHARASDEYHVVRLEAHDGPPPDDLGDWTDAVETPYRSRTSALSLDSLTGARRKCQLALPTVGDYRVRLCRRPADEGDVWRAQFWPVRGPVEPPRWLARSGPAVGKPEPGWRAVLGYGVIEVSWALTGFGSDSSAAWLDAPLDRDSAQAGDVADQLKVPRPVTRRDAIPLLLAAGLIIEDATAKPHGYRLTPDPPLAKDVLNLPAAQVESLDKQDLRHRFAYVTADIVSVVLWSETPVLPGLADRLLLSQADTDAAVRAAEAMNLITISDGEITARPRKPPRPATRQMLRRAWQAAPVELPVGAPPRAGFVSGDGAVTVWSGGEPRVLTSLGGQPDSAFETAYGIVVFSSGGKLSLVRHDGTVEHFDGELWFRGALSPDGRYLATVESHIGRRSWERPHLIDLADGSRESLPASEQWGQATAVHEGAVYFNAGFDVNRPRPKTIRWRPGQEPEPMSFTISRLDPLSGTILAFDDEPGTLLLRPDGTRNRLPAGRTFELVPHGTQVCEFLAGPPRINLFDPHLGGDSPRVLSLPDAAETSTIMPNGPVWEDADHLLVSLRYGLSGPFARVNIRTGAAETAPVPESIGYRPIPIRPLLSRSV